MEAYRGDRDVLTGPAAAAAGGQAQRAEPAAAPVAPILGTSAPSRAEPALPTTPIQTGAAPRPVGAYPHARRVGDLIYVSGMGPRQPGTDAIPGGPIRDDAGEPLDYDAGAQTHAVIANIAAVLEAAGSSLARVVDVTSFLVDMGRDFAAYNAAYAQHFAGIQASRTTVEVGALPTPIAVEMKVVALAGEPE